MNPPVTVFYQVERQYPNGVWTRVGVPTDLVSARRYRARLHGGPGWGELRTVEVTTIVVVVE